VIGAEIHPRAGSEISPQQSGCIRTPFAQKLNDAYLIKRIPAREIVHPYLPDKLQEGLSHVS
jgi:hypothetical protein